MTEHSLKLRCGECGRHIATAFARNRTIKLDRSTKQHVTVRNAIVEVFRETRVLSLDPDPDGLGVKHAVAYYDIWAHPVDIPERPRDLLRIYGGRYCHRWNDGWRHGNPAESVDGRPPVIVACRCGGRNGVDALAALSPTRLRSAFQRTSRSTVEGVAVTGDDALRMIAEHIQKERDQERQRFLERLPQDLAATYEDAIASYLAAIERTSDGLEFTRMPSIECINLYFSWLLTIHPSDVRNATSIGARPAKSTFAADDRP